VKRRVSTTPEADAQIRAIDEWWRENRRSSPNLFLDELTTAFEVIARTPEIGRRYRPLPVPGMRRFLLQRSRYHVYYVPSEQHVRVLTVWHGARGIGPPLRLR
jgi:plasmid stabilization system protein ParE